MMVGVAFGLLQSAITIDCPCRHLIPVVAATSLLPGKYAIPLLHSHQTLCVLRIPRSALARNGLVTLVTSQTSYPANELPWMLRIR